MPDEHENHTFQAQNRLLTQRIRVLSGDRDDLLLALDRLLKARYKPDNFEAYERAQRLYDKVREDGDH